MNQPSVDIPLGHVLPLARVYGVQLTNGAAESLNGNFLAVISREIRQ